MGIQCWASDVFMQIWPSSNYINACDLSTTKYRITTKQSASTVKDTKSNILQSKINSVLGFLCTGCFLQEHVHLGKHRFTSMGSLCKFGYSIYPWFTVMWKEWYLQLLLYLMADEYLFVKWNFYNKACLFRLSQ